MTHPWTETNDQFQIRWGGSIATLALNTNHPGLYLDSGEGPLLGLAGLARSALWDLEALSRHSLISARRVRDRVTATFQPPNWHQTTVKATWHPIEPDGMHLEIELSTRSVGKLLAVEIVLLDALGPIDLSTNPHSTVYCAPRARRFAGDGREPPPSSDPSQPLMRAARATLTLPNAARSYTRAVHTEDLSRAIRYDDPPAARAALLGYDLERGVVLRGRARAWWPTPADDTDELQRQFEAEPPPLTT
jgi:hypothetical protein